MLGNTNVINVDKAMSDTSVNPVQNNVVKEYVDITKEDVVSGYKSADNNLQSQINAQSSVIDTNTSDITRLQTSKQNTLIAGDGIVIENNVISATGGGSGGGSSVTIRDWSV